MTKIKEKLRERTEIPKRKYSDIELRKFHDLIQKFYEPYTFQNGATVSILNREKLMIAYGALDHDGAVIIDDFEPISRHVKFENLFDQYQWWKERNGFAKKKQLEAYDHIARSMKAPEATVEEDIPWE